MEHKLRLLIVENHKIVREGLKLMIQLQDDMEVVGETGNGETSVEIARQLLPDIVLMDISLEGCSGLKATKRIKRICPQVKVLTLTRHEDDGYIQQQIRAGASGYISKQSAPSELINAIRAVGRGNDYIDPTFTKKVMEGYARQLTAPNHSSGLQATPREKGILRLLAHGNSYKEIATHLAISVKTVEVHKTNIMRKLNFKSRVDIVRYAISEGWMNEC